MASSTTKLTTFEEFEKLPDQELRQELRHREVVDLAPPKSGFRAVTEFEHRIADGAVISRARWDGTPIGQEIPLFFGGSIAVDAIFA